MCNQVIINLLRKYAGKHNGEHGFNNTNTDSNNNNVHDNGNSANKTA